MSEARDRVLSAQRLLPFIPAISKSISIHHLCLVLERNKQPPTPIAMSHISKFEHVVVLKNPPYVVCKGLLIRYDD